LNRYKLGCLWFALLLISGCASTPHPAPIRESGFSNPVFPAAPQGHYRIQPGDTLYKIAFQQGLDYRDLATWNELADPGYIRSGDLLRIVPPKPLVKKAAMAVKPYIQVSDIKLKPQVSPEQHEDTVPAVWTWPNQGALLASYGQGLNKGIDIAGERGEPVLAAASGRVVYAGSSLRGYGKLIIIRHGRTLLSAYAHNERILVADGQQVVRGQSIALMGDSDADRIKLHFEIREFGKPVNPLNYLPKKS
jgi:lipoprotein NlpD